MYKFNYVYDCFVMSASILLLK